MAENSIYFLVECLSMHDKRDFRRWAERNKRNPEYLDLFNEYTSLKEPDDTRVLKRMKVSKTRLAVLKTELKESIFDFLAFANDSYEANLYRILNTIASLHRRNHLDYIPRLLEKGKKLAKEYEDLLLLEKFLEKEAYFPASLQTSRYLKDKRFSAHALIEEKAVKKHTEDLIVAIGSQMPNDEKTRSVAETHSTVLKLDPDNFLTAKAQAQHYYNLRIIFKYLGDQNSAIRYCRKYLNVLHKKRKVFADYIERKSRELVVLAAMYIQSGMLKNHHRCIQLMLSLEGNSIPERTKLFQIKYLPAIIHATSTGILSVFQPVEQRAFSELEEFKELIDVDFLLLLSFYLAKYYTISGDFSKSNSCCRLRWEVQRSHPANIKLQNYFLVIEIINHYKLGNLTLIRSLLKSLERYIRIENSPSQYFNLFTELIKSLLKSPTHPNLSTFAAAFSALKNDPVQSHPFNYFDILQWINSLTTGEPLKKYILEDYLSQSSKAKAFYMITSRTTTQPPPEEVTR